MIFYSIAVTLNAKHQEYLWMFVLLLKSLLKTGTFTPGKDHYYLIADQETAKVVSKMPHLGGLVRVVVANDCSDSYDVMKLKYLFPSMLSAGGGSEGGLRLLAAETFVYLDADMLFLRRLNFEIAADSLIVLPEGNPTDTNYCGDPGTKLTQPFGASAGFFVWRYGLRVQSFFQSVLRDLMTSSKRFYCLDQPAFNKYLTVAATGTIDPSLVSFNGHKLDKDKTAILNCAGDPGDGPKHLAKMIDFALAIF